MMVEQLNRDGRTVEHHGGTVEPLIMEQQNISWWNSVIPDGGTVKHLVVEQWNRDGGRGKHVMVEQWNI